MKTHEVHEYLKKNGFRHSIRKSKGDIYTDGISNIFVSPTSVNKNRNLLNLKADVKKAIRRREESSRPGILTFPVIPKLPSFNSPTIDHGKAQREFAKKMLELEAPKPEAPKPEVITSVVPQVVTPIIDAVEPEAQKEEVAEEETKVIEKEEQETMARKKRTRRNFDPVTRELILIRVKELVLGEGLSNREVTEKLNKEGFRMSNGDPLEDVLIAKYALQVRSENPCHKRPENVTTQPVVVTQSPAKENEIPLPPLFSLILKDRQLSSDKKIKLMLAYIEN